MKIEIGHRYRFEPNEGCKPMLQAETVEVAAGLYGLGAPVVRLANGTSVFVLEGGEIPGMGRLVEIAPPPTVTALRPAFGHDPGEFARLQRVFREGYDLTLGTGR